MPCPSGALCPGGSRLWPREGFWAASDTVSSVTPCTPPDPTAKCAGWNITAGAVELWECLSSSVLPLRRLCA